jgi:hypothetical protein
LWCRTKANLCPTLPLTQALPSRGCSIPGKARNGC